MAAGEHVSLLGKLRERIQLCEEYKTRTEEMIHRILEQHAMWRSQHTAILEVYATLEGWTKDAVQQAAAVALPSMQLQRSCPSDSSAPRPARWEQVVVLDGPDHVWDRHFGHVDFEDQVPQGLEREISQQVAADEVDVSEDEDVMLVADALKDASKAQDMAMPEPYTQPAAETQASQQPDKRSSLGNAIRAVPAGHDVGAEFQV